MNVNLHIDSIVLDGLDLGPGESQLLQQAIANQLDTMLTQQASPVADTNNRVNHRGNSIRLYQAADAMSLGSQLANVIYANIPQSLGPVGANGGQS